MRILNISLDKKLFAGDSDVRKRVFDYSQIFERFDLLIATGKGFKAEEYKKIAIWPTNSFGRVFYLFDIYKLGKRMIKKYKDEIISAQDPFETGFLAWLLAKKFKIKFQIQVHGDFFGSKHWRQESPFNRLRFLAGVFILKRANGIRVVSQRIRSSLIRLGVNDDKISVVPIYSEIQKSEFNFQVRNPRSKNKFIFLTVGRLVTVKNVGMQIEAMAEIIKKYSDAELWIVGDGKKKRSLMSSINSLGLGASIKFFGWREGNDLNNFYNQARAFLLTSNYEGWGMAVIEAAEFSAPIIMTDVGCAGEVFINNENAVIIPVGGKKELVDAMLRFIQDKDFCLKLGWNAKKAIGLLPNKEKTLMLYKESYEKAYYD